MTSPSSGSKVRARCRFDGFTNMLYGAPLMKCIARMLGPVLMVTSCNFRLQALKNDDLGESSDTDTEENMSTIELIYL